MWDQAEQNELAARAQQAGLVLPQGQMSGALAALGLGIPVAQDDAQ